jgi:4-carboxymuconolactone decarboxylase
MVTEEARRNHAQLFPNHSSTLTVSDPELVELFENFAFGEVLKDSALEPRTRLMVQLAALIGCQGLGEYRVMLGGALNVGVSPVEVKEIVYQAVPYVGVAKVFEFFHVTNEVLRGRGIELPLPSQSTTDRTTRLDRGLEVQRRMFGERIDQLYARSPADEQPLLRLLSANCFGDWVTRGGLDLKMRELLTFSMLAALGGCEPQLAGHVAANLAVGNDRQVLVGTLVQLLPFIGYPRTLNALRIVDEGAPPPKAG